MSRISDKQKAMRIVEMGREGRKKEKKKKGGGGALVLKIDGLEGG